MNDEKLPPWLIKALEEGNQNQVVDDFNKMSFEKVGEYDPIKVFSVNSKLRAEELTTLEEDKKTLMKLQFKVLSYLQKLKGEERENFINHFQL